MSLPVNPVASQPRVVSLPQVQKIVQDVTDCIHQLKEDFVETRVPINDDSQVLQRFCAKLEHLLQFEMKERFSLLGKRKDYWDYFCECLGSTRGSNDGIKYVKSLGENKTSLGKGRAFLRFALVHQRLADSIQQCIIHPKTSDWYLPGSVWMQPKVASSIVGTLYDLNDLHFDLSPRGYDLDNAWPSFARRSSGSQNWNIPISRRSSITSMDTVSLSMASNADPEEFNRLQQQLASAETARSVLAETVGTLEQERQKAEQSVWMTQGELSAMQEQLKSTTTRNTELQGQLLALQNSHEKLQAEKDQQATDLQERSKQLDTQHHQLTQERERLTQQELQLKQQIEEEKSRLSSEIQNLQQKLSEMEEERNRLTSKVASLEETLERSKEWDAKKEQQVTRLEQQVSTLEQRNNELTDDLARSLSSREHDATSQLDSAKKYHEILAQLKDVEAENVQLQASVADLKHRCDVSEKNIQDEKSKQGELQVKLEAEIEKSKSVSDDLHKQSEAFEKERKTLNNSVTVLASDLESAQKVSEKTKSELESKKKDLEQGLSRHSDLLSLISQTLMTLSETSGASGSLPQVDACSSAEISHFVKACKKSAAGKQSSMKTSLQKAKKEKEAVVTEKHKLQESLAAILGSFPDKPDSSNMDLQKQTQEVQTRVQALCTELSDLTTNRDFLREQLQLAKGEHSDKGKELSHLEGRLVELEKALKESRASESSLQGQVASLEVMQKNEESRGHDLDTQLQTALNDVEVKATAISRLEAEQSDLETQVKDTERQREELQRSLEGVTKELETVAENASNLKEKLESLEKSAAAKMEELTGRDQQLEGVQQKLQVSEKEAESLRSTINDLEQQKSATNLDLENVKRQLSESSDQVRLLTEEFEGERTSKTELTNQFEGLKGEVDRLQGVLREKESEISTQNSLSEEWVRSLEAERDGLKQKLDSTQAEVSDLQQKYEEATTQLTEVKDSLQTLSSEKDIIASKFEETTSLLQEKEVTFSEEIQTLCSQLDTFKTQKEEIQRSASSSEEEKSRVLVKKQTAIETLQKEKSALEKEVRSLSDTNSALEKEIAGVQKELADLRTSAEEDKQTESQQFQQLKKQLEDPVQKLKEENESVSAELQNLKVQLQNKTQDLEEAKSQTDNLRTESERLRSNSATEKSELEDSLEKLQSRFSELQTSLDAIIKEKEDLSASQITMHEEIMELKADLAASADGYKFLLQSSQKVQEEKEAEIESLKLQISQLEQSRMRLTSDLELASGEQSSLKEKFQSLESEKQNLQEELSPLEKKLETKAKEADDLKQLVQSLTSSVSVLESDDQSRRSELEQVQTTLEENEKSYTMQIEALQQELSALQFQLSAEQLQYEESVKAMGSHKSNLSEMSTRLEEQESLITQLEEELSSLKADWEKERTNQNQQLGELKSLLRAKEAESKHLHEVLQRKSDKLEESLLAAELYQKENSALRKSLDRDIEERELEIRTLRSDNGQLKKQLVKVVREKAALWQQTDELAFEHKRKAGEKWMESSAVTKCMGCQSDFSLFLRKHHCRLCGRIFCWTCSDYWFDSPSSSRKARACKQCYVELQNLDSSIAKASLLPEYSDEEGSNMGSTTGSTTGSIGGSDVQSPNSSQVDNRSTSSLQREAFLDASGNKEGKNSPGSSSDDIYATGDGNDRPDTPTFTDPPSTSTPAKPSASAGLSKSSSQDSTFQVITQEDVTKSIAAYDNTAAHPSIIDVPNMSSSMLLSADDLATGQINRQSETWVKAGRSFAVPISVDCPYTVISWQFTVQPKDIQFSITYLYDEQQTVSQAEVIVGPIRCNSVTEPVKGELTAKKPGIYTLVFDNSYSRMTAKKIHYELKYDGIK